ncbi:MAG: peptide-methionine (R)-S-oxide reductase MsrB [Gammaproteobacteria bacterium]
MNRRSLLALTGLAAAAPLLDAVRTGAAAKTTDAVTAMQTRWRELWPAGRSIVEARPPIERSRKAWKRELPKAAYEVLFEEDTERAGTSPLDREKRRGVFVCRACGLPLFTSEMKFDSGTGWPSFFTAIPGHLATKTDFKLIWPRTEYHCVKCGGHQGHVFDDGPAPTGERWCNNGVALSFVPADDAQEPSVS